MKFSTCSISLDKTARDRMKALAQSRGMTRSEYVRFLIREDLENSALPQAAPKKGGRK